MGGAGSRVSPHQPAIVMLDLMVVYAQTAKVASNGLLVGRLLGVEWLVVVNLANCGWLNAAWPTAGLVACDDHQGQPIGWLVGGTSSGLGSRWKLDLEGPSTW